MSEYLGYNLVAGATAKKSATPLLHHIWSDHLIEDISWLRADTFSWQSGSVYTSAYNELLSQYNNASSTTETDYSIENFTKVGSPTVSNGIASGFSTSNYINLANSFASAVGSNTWETLFKITTGSDVTTTQGVFGGASGTYLPDLPQISSSHFDLNLSSNGSSYNIANAVGTYTVLANTTYWVRCKFTGTEYTLEYSLDGETFITDISVTSSSYIESTTDKNMVGLRVSTPFLGTINLNESYIKINNEYWWQPYPLTYKRTPKGYKIADSSMESLILSKYTSYGIAWYYILDTTNTRFKLPRTKWGFKGLRDNVGDDVAQDVLLPNITGNSGGIYLAQYTGGGSGALYQTSGGGGMGSATNSITRPAIALDASRSSSVYSGDGTNTLIQERATQMYLYFFVGNFSQSATEQTAGLNSELFNGKVDKVGSSYIVKTTYVNGTSGYRIWSDGYCEQWGYSPAGTQPRTVTFFKTFSDTNWGVSFGDSNADGYAEAQSRIVKLYTKSTNQMTCTGIYQNGVSTDYMFYWRTYGYLAEGEY